MLYVIGIGPGDKRYLTLMAIEVVKNSDVVVGSRRALDLFDIEEDKKYYLTKNLREELKEIINSTKDKNINVSILSTGDPCFSGLLKTILSLGVKKEDIEVISGISSIQIAAARLKISWEDYEIITLHGREENRRKLLNLIKNNQKVIFLPSNVKEDMEYLINNGVNPGKEMIVCENLTYENERIVRDSLKNLLKMDFSYLCICILEGDK
ncbi:cobalt-precorrin-7 (C(5))-methyltransferase [Methanotorris formicicus]|uniref:Precorrin-6y C5,15-methyltransferase (Decarboxylating), CbiE subunit n=1 Tax=Methanotorris formicicus Mc-S-70 TaxID=647171 RepID=H1L0I6_9EURY|nr:cobalt-precorrin-7 (C(5))-methyltransferase [Methanotorris formicicus]EHP84818.1 precorrin-6y C5,15-methyltransferase (decarboxylating), CbiE subunit [Methanotorris formicicus Mc-S-70]